MLGPDRRVLLDLGQVYAVATVKLNGQDLGDFYKHPFVIDITDAARPGENHIEIQVANTWRNRMIGDEHLELPPETDWSGGRKGKRIAGTWPTWLLAGERVPGNRITFSNVRRYGKDDKLEKAGLGGPVTLTIRRKRQAPGTLR